MPRDDFPQKIKRSLRERVGGYCSNPNCMAATMGPGKYNESSVVSIGIAAHICAAASGGPRHDSTMSPEIRSSIENGIWLCSNCANLIDRNSGLDFSPTVLRKWKQDAESEADKRLQSGSRIFAQRWQGRLSSIVYCNVPRVLQYLDPDADEVEFASALSDGFPEGYIFPYLVALKNAVRSLEISAISAELVESVSGSLIGSIISFDGSCRTKNGAAISGRKLDEKLLMQFDIEKSPHFYWKNSQGITFRFPYDPKWVTTTTAFSELRSGRTNLAGLGLVKKTDNANASYIVSPLIVGFPQRSFHEVMDR